MGKVRRNLWAHAPWWVIAASLTATALGIASLVYFQEERKAPRPAFVLSATREYLQEHVEPPAPDDRMIQIAPIPYQQIEEPLAESGVDPMLEIPEDFMISNELETEGGDVEGTVAGKPDGEFINPSADLYRSIGIGKGSSDRGGLPWGNGPGGPRTRGPRISGPPRGSGERIPLDEALEGLKWLARHQSPDGAWRPDSFSDRCQGKVCDGNGQGGYEVGCTGLALLAFLGAGFDQHSRAVVPDRVLRKNVSFGPVVNKGLRWLLEQQGEDGAIGTIQREFFYGQAIATMALCETYAAAPNDITEEAVQKALEFLVRNQSTDPSGTGFLGWRYVPGKNESDTSVTGWCVMALKSAELAGLGDFSGALHGALGFVIQASAPSFLVGYRAREDAGQKTYLPGVNEDFADHPAMTAVGMCVRIFADRDHKDPALAAGAKHLLADLPVWDGAKKTKDYYYWYYGSLALYQFDGPESPRRDGSLWKRWNEAMLKALLEHQGKEGDGCAHGSWDGEDRWGHAGGRLYATAINTLTLEVYYRYPNAFVGVPKTNAQAVRAKPK